MKLTKSPNGMVYPKKEETKKYGPLELTNKTQRKAAGEAINKLLNYGGCKQRGIKLESDEIVAAREKLVYILKDLFLGPEWSCDILT